MVINAQLCKYTKKHQFVHFKIVNFMVDELNLKVIIKNKVKIMTISKKINEINNCLKKNAKQSPQMY